MTSVLYDVPGPRARVRNRILAVVTTVVVLAVIGFVLWRFTLSGQFTAAKWSVFTYTNVWMTIGEMLLNTLRAFALAGLLSLALGFALAIGRLSEHAWVRVPVMVVTELFRAVPVLVMMMICWGLRSTTARFSPRHCARASRHCRGGRARRDTRSVCARAT
jgi:glutamate transport system permease protein